MAWGGRAQAAETTRASSGVQRTSPPDKGTGEPANYGPGRRAASPPGQCTVTVATAAEAATLLLASLDIPSLTARNHEISALSALAVAEAADVLAIDNTDGSVLDHDTVLLLSSFPAASLTSAAKVALSPTV